jgi:hypothetical protein
MYYEKYYCVTTVYEQRYIIYGYEKYYYCVNIAYGQEKYYYCVNVAYGQEK